MPLRLTIEIEPPSAPGADLEVTVLAGATVLASQGGATVAELVEGLWAQALGRLVNANQRQLVAELVGQGADTSGGFQLDGLVPQVAHRLAAGAPAPRPRRGRPPKAPEGPRAVPISPPLPAATGNAIDLDELLGDKDGGGDASAGAVVGDTGAGGEASDGDAAEAAI